MKCSIQASLRNPKAKFGVVGFMNPFYTLFGRTHFWRQICYVKNLLSDAALNSFIIKWLENRVKNAETENLLVMR